jgi:hypothetical protein
MLHQILLGLVLVNPSFVNFVIIPPAAPGTFKSSFHQVPGFDKEDDSEEDSIG